MVAMFDGQYEFTFVISRTKNEGRRKVRGRSEESQIIHSGIHPGCQSATMVWQEDRLVLAEGRLTHREGPNKHATTGCGRMSVDRLIQDPLRGTKDGEEGAGSAKEVLEVPRNADTMDEGRADRAEGPAAISSSEKGRTAYRVRDSKGP